MYLEHLDEVDLNRLLVLVQDKLEELRGQRHPLDMVGEYALEAHIEELEGLQSNILKELE